MSDLVAPVPSSSLLQTLDDSKVTRFQLKIMFISGMGFYTDAYDLFVIVAEHNGAATPRPDTPHRSGSLRGEPATPPTDRLRRGRAPTSDLGV